MAPVPLLLCGKVPTMASSFASAIPSFSSDYIVVHVVHSVSAGIKEIPALLRGEKVRPESKLGENANEANEVVRPRGIAVGKGFSDEEVEELRKACKERAGGKGVPWMLADDAKMSWGRIGKAVATGGYLIPTIVAERVVLCCQEHGMVPGKEEEFGDVTWDF